MHTGGRMGVVNLELVLAAHQVREGRSVTAGGPAEEHHDVPSPCLK